MKAVGNTGATFVRGGRGPKELSSLFPSSSGPDCLWPTPTCTQRRLVIRILPYFRSRRLPPRPSFSAAVASSRSDNFPARRSDTTPVARLQPDLAHSPSARKTVSQQCLSVRPAISRGQRLQAEYPPGASQTATLIATVSTSSILWRLSRTQTSRTTSVEASQDANQISGPNADFHFAAQKRLRELKSKISAQSKKNFVLERDVRYLDGRIALLIQNRMALDEVRIDGSQQLPNLESPIRIVRTFLSIVEPLEATCGVKSPVQSPHAALYAVNRRLQPDLLLHLAS